MCTRRASGELLIRGLNLPPGDVKCMAAVRFRSAAENDLPKQAI